MSKLSEKVAPLPVVRGALAQRSRNVWPRWSDRGHHVRERRQRGFSRGQSD